LVVEFQTLLPLLLLLLLHHPFTPQNGQVYVVENNQKLQPLVKTAALSCINPNVWFDHRTWSPGTLTNFASSRRLFKESHQPNRRSVFCSVVLYFVWLTFLIA
jgi:hypothetical protein